MLATVATVFAAIGLDRSVWSSDGFCIRPCVETRKRFFFLCVKRKASLRSNIHTSGVQNSHDSWAADSSHVSSLPDRCQYVSRAECLRRLALALFAPGLSSIWVGMSRWWLVARVRDESHDVALLPALHAEIVGTSKRANVWLCLMVSTLLTFAVIASLKFLGIVCGSRSFSHCDTEEIQSRA